MNDSHNDIHEFPILYDGLIKKLKLFIQKNETQQDKSTQNNQVKLDNIDDIDEEYIDPLEEIHGSESVGDLDSLGTFGEVLKT